MTQNERMKKTLTSHSTTVFLAGIQPDASYAEKTKAIQKAAEEATDFSWLTQNDSVLIKPVVNSEKTYPATTDPLAIIAMIRLLKEKGAGRIVVGDLAGIADVRFYPDHLEGSTRRIMENVGIAQATLEAGGELLGFEEAGWGAFYPESPIRGTNWKEPLMMPSILKEIDHIILLPRCARHMMAASTLGMKAAVGYWRSDTRTELHRDAKTFYEKIAESNTVPTLVKKQRLILTVADKVLTTFGPNEGYVIQPEPGLIISSDSIVAHDMVSLAWLLENRKYTPEDELKSRYDTSKTLANKSNKGVVFILSRSRKTQIRSQRLNKEDLETIWDDHVLRRAFNIFDGVPNVILKPTNNLIPEELQKTLQRAVSPS
jgi:uncharacterized protein (DUF362 family)